MRNLFKKVAAILVAITATVSFAACDDGGSGNSGNSGKTPASEQESVDTSKTTIRVFNYKAGYGDAWLSAIKESFEKRYANESFESGKKGVQVLFDSRMETWKSAQVSSSAYDVFFLENQDLVEYRNGEAIENISDIVTSKGIDGKTIESKLNDAQKEFFGNGNGEYDALPRYYGTTSIIYNIDLFEEKGLYIGKNGGYVGKDGEKSLGADGLPNTDDDGLPTTYEEFFDLLDVMVQKNVTPLCWNGKHYTHYLSYFFDNLVADYEGVDQMALNYTYNGTATDLVKIDADGKVALNADGTPETESLAITTANGYELARQAGKYYALQFMHNMISDPNYYYKQSFDGNFTQVLSQQKFLQNGYTNNEKPIAMLLDGPWWQNEASTIFEEMASTDAKYSKTNRRFGWMPLPKATADKVGSGKSVYSDDLNTFVCIKKGTNVLNAAKAFVQYVSSDEALTLFTKTTGAPCAYGGYMTEADKESLSSFSKSVIDYAEKSDTYYRVSLNKFYNMHLDKLRSLDLYSTTIDGTAYGTVPYGIYETSEDVAAKTYFENYYKTFKKNSFWG